MSVTTDRLLIYHQGKKSPCQVVSDRGVNKHGNQFCVAVLSFKNRLKVTATPDWLLISQWVFQPHFFLTGQKETVSTRLRLAWPCGHRALHLRESGIGHSARASKKNASPMPR
ncbi:MAG: hypothetical protein LUD79_03515 [Oscillospiraceae bacterium]|nr:hypothetical protein [Oscillospiraceae bacterium]